MKKIIFVLPLIFLLAGCSSDNNYSNSYSEKPSGSTSYSDTPIGDQPEENVYNQEEIDPNRNDGTRSVEACNNRTGSCYDLDAEISDGQVEQIEFPNGGHLDLDGATLDEDGSASGDSYTETNGYDGDAWDVTCTDCE